MRTKRLFLVALAIGASVPSISSSATRQEENDRRVCVRSLVVPPYPPLARQAAVQGDVTAIVTVDSRGEVSELSSINGPALLVDRVAAAVKKWKFEVPFKEPTQIRIIFRFVLAGNETDRNIETEVSASLPGLIEITTNPPIKVGPDVEYRKPKGRRSP